MSTYSISSPLFLLAGSIDTNKPSSTISWKRIVFSSNSSRIVGCICLTTIVDAWPPKHLYAVKGATTENYAVFFDNTRRHRWDFTSASQWNVETSGGALRFYVMAGPDLLDLRKDYMGLVGRPQVPPKRMFGLWISEFGYDNWAELDSKLATLRSNQFPLDGFVLDLQWFGGIPSVTGQCAIGSLNFDTNAFPDPAATIQGLARDQGVGIMLIEEAYVCTELPEHAALRAENCLVTTGVESTQPTVVNGFFGSGGIIDYTNDACGAFVHDFRRQALIDLGVIGHWTDLGEPEVRDPNGGYAVGSHREAHNLFNFRWLRGIHSGYRTDDSDQRPFMMSRSGAAGRPVSRPASVS
jgi:alpha-glucosidase